ncbi:LysR substrate-binding domain-containing protein [Pseudomonas oryzihabitans]|uniref:LysR substrate-binding domain-containing protein n=1 Tax=Pseudomonas oryzihabitans TaxID=47885 RepID=UPI0028950812|nr:LysR substrate-binding domain-containing protein [Pseudomonas oryzihabitans]MDT3723077.1 LysR substrate-binding domain-containing protein [Pseudomonas oryzihabitans]
MRRFLPSLSALQAFEAAARHLSFTRAAEDLFVTQSGISRQITKLEQMLGLLLFERSGSRLVLTDAGTKYLSEVVCTLNKLEEASIDLVRGRKADSSLIVGANPTLVSRWLAPRLRSFVQTAPDVPVEIGSIESDVDFNTCRVDIAVMRGVGTWDAARAQELFAEHLVVVASPKLLPLGERYNRLDFSQIPKLQNASRPSLWIQWLRASGLINEGIIQGMRFTQSEMLISAALSGLGLAVVPIHYVEQELKAGTLHLPFGEPVPSGESYWVVSPERKSHKPDVVCFRGWLMSQARGLRL